MNNVEFNVNEFGEWKFKTQLCGNNPIWINLDTNIFKDNKLVERFALDAICKEVSNKIEKYIWNKLENSEKDDVYITNCEPYVFYKNDYYHIGIICWDWFYDINLIPPKFIISPYQPLDEQIKRQNTYVIEVITRKLKQFAFEQGWIEPIEQYEILGYEEALTKEQYEQIVK